MKQKNQRLINEVNKLIKIILTKEGELYLPEVGSLKVTSNDDAGARTLSFSTQPCGISIVEIIAERGNCTVGQASKVYKKWLEEVRVGSKVEIEGIATIEGEVSTTAPEMNKRLNPIVKQKPKAAVTEESKVAPKYEYKESKQNIWLWVGAFAVIALIIAISLANGNKEEAHPSSECKAAEATEQRSVIESDLKAESAPQTSTEPQPFQEPEEIKETMLKSSARFVTSDIAIEHFTATSNESTEPKRYRVVCGVLLSRVNAGRLVLDINNLSTNLEVTPHIYPRNSGYMVVAFESESFRSCVDFIQDNSSELYDSMWIYDDKKM